MTSSVWIHCNYCYAKYQNSHTKFYLTECGHTYCQTCANKIAKDEKCAVCSAKTKTILLSKDAGQHILSYFQPVVQPSCNETYNIMQFQSKNQLSLLKNREEKYTYAKNEVARLYKLVDSMRKENLKLKNMLMGRSPNSRPTFTTSTPFGNNSGISPGLYNSHMMSPISTNISISSDRPGYAIRMNQQPKMMHSYSGEFCSLTWQLAAANSWSDAAAEDYLRFSDHLPTDIALRIVRELTVHHGNYLREQSQSSIPTDFSRGSSHVVPVHSKTAAGIPGTTKAVGGMPGHSKFAAGTPLSMSSLSKLSLGNGASRRR